MAAYVLLQQQQQSSSSPAAAAGHRGEDRLEADGSPAQASPSRCEAVEAVFAANLNGKPKGKKAAGGSGDGANSSSTTRQIRTAEETDDFMMNVYKLEMCPRR